MQIINDLRDDVVGESRRRAGFRRLNELAFGLLISSIRSLGSSYKNYTMSAQREGPNPLRPYYIPPSVGSPPDIASNASTAPASRHASAAMETSSFGSSARNILADMDYSDYLSSSSPSAKDVVRQLAEQAVWKYTSVFLAQPFEVAKTVLQVHVAGSDPRFSTQAQVAERTRRRPEAYRDRDRDGQYDVRQLASSQCQAANVIP